jgi:hypothetical protein
MKLMYEIWFYEEPKTDNPQQTLALLTKKIFEKNRGFKQFIKPH